MDFNELRSRAGLFNSEVTNLLAVSLSTAKRWSSQNSAPVYVIERLSMMAGTHPDWYGIRILGGELGNAAGYVMTRNDIDTAHYKDSLLSQYAGLAKSM